MCFLWYVGYIGANSPSSLDAALGLAMASDYAPNGKDVRWDVVGRFEVYAMFAMASGRSIFTPFVDHQ